MSKTNKNKQDSSNNKQFMLNVDEAIQLVSRVQLMSRLGKDTFGGNRDVYKTLGYPRTLDYKDFITRYNRQDIAAAIINRPVDATWIGNLVITETGDNDQLQRQWKELEDSLKLKSKFKRVDKLSQLGEYAVLFLGFSDVKKVNELQRPVTGSNLKLNYVKPYGQENAEIHSYVKDPNNERYGQPEMYRLTIDIPDMKGSTVKVHHTRIIHVAGELLESEYKGVPLLQRVYNRLIDLEKLTGGSGEMFWRGARPGYAAIADPEYKIADGDRRKMKAQLTEYENDLRRFLSLEGVDIKKLDQQLTDPLNYVDVQLQMISAVTGIPKRILIGAERGELASSEDKNSWLKLIKTRREEFAEDDILLPFIDKSMQYGILPKMKREEWVVEWEDLFAPSEKEKAEVGKIRSAAIKEYSQNPMAEMIVPREIFQKYMLGMNDEQIKDIAEMVEQLQRETEIEEQLSEEERRIMEEEEKNNA